MNPRLKKLDTIRRGVRKNVLCGDFGFVFYQQTVIAVVRLCGNKSLVENDNERISNREILKKQEDSIRILNVAIKDKESSYSGWF